MGIHLGNDTNGLWFPPGLGLKIKDIEPISVLHTVDLTAKQVHAGLMNYCSMSVSGSGVKRNLGGELNPSVFPF